MRHHTKYPALLSLAFGALLFTTACKKNNTEVQPTLNATLVRNLPADTTFVAPGGGAPASTGRHTFFNFANNAIVPSTDSNSTNWDVAFRATTIIVNSGSSGPGNAAAQVLTGTTINDVTQAPETGYVVDNATTKAIPTGSGNGWYTATPPPTIISPIPGRVIVIRTASGKYVKLEILSYYKDAPAAPDVNSRPRWYTFRFVYQPDGSRNF